MTTHTHEFVRDLDGFTGTAKLWRVTPPLKWGGWYEGDDEGVTEYVVSSATVVLFSGPETYLFPADENGKVVDWGELDGSYRGGLDHDEAIRGLRS